MSDRDRVWYHGGTLIGSVSGPLWLTGSRALAKMHAEATRGQVYSFRIDPSARWFDITKGDTQWAPIYQSLDSVGWNQALVAKLRARGTDVLWDSEDRQSSQIVVLNPEVLQSLRSRPVAPMREDRYSPRSNVPEWFRELGNEIYEAIAWQERYAFEIDLRTDKEGAPPAAATIVFFNASERSADEMIQDLQALLDERGIQYSVVQTSSKKSGEEQTEWRDAIEIPFDQLIPDEEPLEVEDLAGEIVGAIYRHPNGMDPDEVGEVLDRIDPDKQVNRNELLKALMAVDDVYYDYKSEKWYAGPAPGASAPP